MVQQPLYQIFVSFEPRTVTTCDDTSHILIDDYGPPSEKCYHGKSVRFAFDKKIVGLDREPAYMSTIGDYHGGIKRLTSQLPSFSENDYQRYFWIDQDRPESHDYTGSNTDPQSMFVVAFQTNTSTGVLRHHAMRLNSSIVCTMINESDFPFSSAWSGTSPFVVDFPSQTHTNGTMGIQVCVPGDQEKSLWTLSRNRQDIKEEAYLLIGQAFEWVSNSTALPNGNVTFHCTARTTRGYFELPNYYNNGAYGPLIGNWPSPKEMEEQFNDYVTDYNYTGLLPTEKYVYAKRT